EWGGDLAGAVKWARRRLEVYRPLAGGRLPGDFLTERADAYVMVAELELDRPGPAPHGPSLPGPAREGNPGGRPPPRARAPDRPAEDQAPYDRQAGLARIYLARGKYHLFRYERNGAGDDREAAAAPLKKAWSLLTRVQDARAHQPDDLYRLALAHALWGRLAD